MWNFSCECSTFSDLMLQLLLLSYTLNPLVPLLQCILKTPKPGQYFFQRFLRPIKNIFAYTLYTTASSYFTFSIAINLNGKMEHDFQTSTIKLSVWCTSLVYAWRSKYIIFQESLWQKLKIWGRNGRNVNKESVLKCESWTSWSLGSVMEGITGRQHDSLTVVIALLEVHDR